MLAQFAKRALALNIELSFTDALKEHIAKTGTNLQYGARPLKRTIQKEIEDNLSEEMLKGLVSPGDSVIVDAIDGIVSFKKPE